MINIIFKTRVGFNVRPNELLNINSDYDIKDNNLIFGPLTKTIIFIGENNSGKSRFLRYLFSESYYGMSNENIDLVNQSLKRCLGYWQSQGYKDRVSMFKDIYLTINEDSFFDEVKGRCRALNYNDRYYFPVIRGVKDYKTIINEKLKDFLDSTKLIQNKDSIYHYISLLNLEKKGIDNFDIYNEIIYHEYFKEYGGVKNNILTGGKLYQQIKSMLLGDEKQRRTIEEFQSFLQETFFSEYGKVQLIPYEEKKELYVKIGRDERAIYDWGDGTQQLITILFALFVYKDELGKQFFIEEPELYLHPGILRKFIEVINSDIFKNHQYFITTHSNIVLDVSADSGIEMSIFKFKKIKNKSEEQTTSFTIEQCNNGDSSLLNELGVRNSSVFLSNCSIWVEGITDRLYLKYFLSLYMKKYNDKIIFRENLDYTFIEYGGGNITHFNFSETCSDDSINARYINNKIFLVADGDMHSTSTKKKERKENLNKVLKDNFYELPVNEIENLVTQDILKKVLVKQNPSNEEEIEQKLAKPKNFGKEKLGKFIDKLFENKLKKYGADSGTINNKLDFCKDVIELTTDYDMLSEEAKILTEKIYSFINNNQ